MKKQNGIPVQEYELINISMQGVNGGIALACAHCGRTIFNTATIKGKQDCKTYIVGLICVKKLLNKIIYFNFETMMDYEHELAKWNEAVNTRKWIEKQQQKRESTGQSLYKLILIEYKSEKDEQMFFIKLLENGKYAGSTKSISLKYKSIFTPLLL